MDEFEKRIITLLEKQQKEIEKISLGFLALNGSLAELLSGLNGGEDEEGGLPELPSKAMARQSRLAN